MTTTFKALGKTVTEFEGLEAIQLHPTVTKSDFEDTVVAQVKRLQFHSDEVTAICPVTGQPDLYQVWIKILPDLYSIESKSLKLYLGQFRNEGIFAEDLAAKINMAVFQCTRPYGCSTTIEQKSRGGITLTAQARLGKEVE